MKDSARPILSETLPIATEMSTEDMADAFDEIERHDLQFTGPLACSINTLQEWRPDLTDEVLAEFDILRGRDFVTIWNGKIMRGIEI